MARRRPEAPEAAMIRLQTEGVLGASAWFSNSEPFFAMVFDPMRFTADRAKKKFLAAVRRDVRDMWRGGDYGMSLSAMQDDVHWTGIHRMSFEDMIPHNEYDRREAIEGLLGDGWAFVPTP
jgi:hypothetical protein